MITQPGVRGYRTQEQVIIAAAGPFVEHIGGQLAQQQRRQRQCQRVARLLLHDPDRVPAPVDIAEPQRHDVTGPQSRR